MPQITRIKEQEINTIILMLNRFAVFNREIRGKMGIGKYVGKKMYFPYFPLHHISLFPFSFSIIIFSCFIFLFSIPLLYAQFPEFSVSIADLDKQIADNAFDERNYYQAIEYYTKIFDKEHNNAYAVYRLADSYEKLNDYANAEVWYKISMNLNISKFPLSEYKYSLLLKRNNKHTEAIKQLEHFMTVYKGEYSNFYHQWAQNEIEGSRMAISMLIDTQQVQVYNVGAPINSSNDDFAPVNFSDLLVYSSYNSNNRLIIEKETKNIPTTKLLVSFFEDTSWRKPIEFQTGTFSKPGYHACNGSFSTDANRFYFTFCKEDENHAILCEIYVSINNKTFWSEPVKLNDNINQPNVNNTQPCISYLSDNIEILFFSSNRERGYGGYDIWYSLVKKGTEYSEVKNVHDMINTSGDEITPYFEPHSKILYFSSNGLPTIGGFDVFSSLKTGKFWVKAKNMGYPINTSANDTYYTLTSKQGKGFLVSNRTGGFLSNGTSCCQDIYSFQWKDTSIYIEHSNKQVAPKIDTVTLWKDAEKEIINKAYILKNVYFEFDKTVLLPGSEKDIDLLFLYINEHPDVKIEIGAHTDNKGSTDYNTNLSQHRAQAVVDYLVAKGIERKKMIAKGYGETQPIAANEHPDESDNPEGRQMNRRVEFKIIEKVNMQGE